MIGICVPTRNLVFTKTVEAIENIRQGFNTKLYFSSDLPIPDGHNQLCEKALADGCDYVLFIEEDVVAPKGSLEKLLAADADIACIDYGVNGWGCVTKNSQGEILWSGLGLTLIKKEVFEALERPYFRVDKVLRLNDMTWQDLPEDYIKNKNYGTLDIYFCTKARGKGFKIKQVEGEADHLRLVNLGERGKNNGLHIIESKPRISKNQII